MERLRTLDRKPFAQLPSGVPNRRLVEIDLKKRPANAFGGFHRESGSTGRCTVRQHDGCVRIPDIEFGPNRGIAGFRLAQIRVVRRNRSILSPAALRNPTTDGQIELERCIERCSIGSCLATRYDLPNHGERRLIYWALAGPALLGSGAGE